MKPITTFHSSGVCTLLAGLALAAAWGATPVGAQTPQAFADHGSYYPGEKITVRFSGGPGNKTDWIGVYPEDVVPGSVGSTIWNYVSGTQSATIGLKEGSVEFPNGLNLAGVWDVHFLEKDGYNSLFKSKLTVVDPSSPLIHASKPVYTAGEDISITFTNGPANPKDWIGVYKVGETPGPVPSTIWNYVNGTQTATVGAADGAILFKGGLPAAGQWVAYFFVDDSYNVLTSEPITVQAPTGSQPKVVAVEPADSSTNGLPAQGYSATIQNGTVAVAPGSVVLKFDGTAVSPVVTNINDKFQVTYSTDAVLPSGSTHTYSLVFADTAGARQTNEVHFTVAPYTSIHLNTPLFFENFDGTAEGSLPTGWNGKTFSEVQNTDVDFGNLDSAAFAGFTVVNVDRFQGSFVTYSNPDRSQAEKDDFKRVLATGPGSVVDGKLVRQMASGRMLFGDSGYRNDRSQVMFASTPQYNLSGKSDIYVSFHGVMEQNQDSIAAIEYTIDGGVNWLPLVYYLEPGDIVKTEASEVDAVATFTTDRGDAAFYTDDTGTDVGGTYGAFIRAPIAADLAPFIQARADDSPTDGKRVELLRAAKADNQASVRFRLTYAGSDSWYFGIDDWGIYSIPAVQESPSLSLSRNAGQVVISWPATATGFTLQSSPAVTGAAWTAVPGVTGSSATINATEASVFYRLKR